MAAQLDILKKNFVEGDVIQITFTFVDSAGSLYDFSGVTKAWFTVKSSFEQTDADALVAINSVDEPAQVSYGIAGPGDGKAEVIMLNANTTGLAGYDRRHYDFQVLDAGDVSHGAGALPRSRPGSGWAVVGSGGAVPERPATRWAQVAPIPPTSAAGTPA